MQYVKYERQGFAGIITIDRQWALNSLNADILCELEQTLDSVSLEETRCIIITGAGEKAFVAGADIGAMEPMSVGQGREWGQWGNALFRKIETFPVPVIAAVNGYALGGGCELALSCDIRIASENAVFGQPEVTLGITPGFGGTQRLPRLIGAARAKELLYTARKLKADEALRIGLVNAVYPAEQLMAESLKLAERISLNAPIAVRAVKKAVDDGLQVGMDEGTDIEVELFGSCFETEDRKNAMKAFSEKRRAEPFKNR